MAGVSSEFKIQPSLESSIHALGLTPQQVKTAQSRTLTAMGSWMIREMRDTLKPGGHQGQPGGDKWADISPAWRLIKQTEGRPTHIGIYRGRMEKSLSQEKDMTRLQVEAGPTVEHASSFHRFRPITPKEDYANKRFSDIYIDALKKVAT